MFKTNWLHSVCSTDNKCKVLHITTYYILIFFVAVSIHLWNTIVTWVQSLWFCLSVCLSVKFVQYCNCNMLFCHLADYLKNCALDFMPSLICFVINRLFFHLTFKVFMFIDHDIVPPSEIVGSNVHSCMNATDRFDSVCLLHTFHQMLKWFVYGFNY